MRIGPTFFFRREVVGIGRRKQHRFVFLRHGLKTIRNYFLNTLYRRHVVDLGELKQCRLHFLQQEI